MTDLIQDRKPWDQQEGEPNEAYARFLVYRNMGVRRSLEAAYIEASGIAPKRTKSPQVSGQWKDDSARWNWVERSSAWDIATLTEVGHAVVVKYVNALELSFQRIIESLTSGAIKPRTWGQVIESITILGGFIPQETVTEIKQRASDAVRVETVKPIGERVDQQP